MTGTALGGGRDGDPPLRVAVVGLGWAGRSIWLPRLSAHPAFTITAAVDPRPDARERARQAGCDGALLADADLIEAGEVDLAVVAVPNYLHAAVATRLLARGIPVFQEKPVCLSSAEADDLAAAEEAGGSVLLAGSAARYRADVLALYELVDKVGAIRHIDLAWVRARGVPGAGGWFTQREQSGGGALVDLGWHLLDTVQPLIGGADFADVIGTISDDFVKDSTAAAGWRGEKPVDGARNDVEDTARGYLITTDGLSVALRASWASHESHDSTLIRVEGSDGVATLHCTFGFSPNRQERSALTYACGGDLTRVPVTVEPIGEEYQRQLDELPGLLADGGSPGRAIEEARRTIRVIEEIYRSARRDRPRQSVPMNLV